MKGNCKWCDAWIYFNPDIKKWVTRQKRWKCGGDANYPVRAHEPIKVLDDLP